MSRELFWNILFCLSFPLLITTSFQPVIEKTQSVWVKPESCAQTVLKQWARASAGPGLTELCYGQLYWAASSYLVSHWSQIYHNCRHGWHDADQGFEARTVWIMCPTTEPQQRISMSMIDNVIVNHVPADVLLRLMAVHLSVTLACQHSWASWGGV